MLLLIDNYDSFTYNLYQYLAELGADVLVRRNDEITPEEAAALGPDRIVISPGPGTPHEAGASDAMIERLGPSVPTLGVCLGHQCIGQVFGGRVVRAPEPVHGKTAAIHHRGVGVLRGLPAPFTATRYHSLIVERASLPAALEVTAETADGLIMGLRHRVYPIEGVQFHPESVLTTAGKDLLRNFLRGECLTAEDAEDMEGITRPHMEKRRTHRYPGEEQRVAEPSLTSAVTASSMVKEEGA
jgi:anthranilate synthase/aminodeoxychorismate synthase-like glutamine amidotransferase